MEAIKYYWVVVKRAWNDTKSFFGWNKKTLTIPALFMLGAVIYWRWQGVEAVTGEIVVVTAFGLAPIGAFAILLFVYNSILAPARIAKETRTEFEETKQRLVIENKRLSASISRISEKSIVLVYDPRSYKACREIYPISQQGKQIEEIIYRVGVANVGKKTLENVEIILERIEEFQTNRCSSLPVTLSPMHSITNSPSSLTINPTADNPIKYVDVFRWKPEKHTIQLCYHSNIAGTGVHLKDTFKLKENMQYILNLSVTGKDMSESEWTILVTIDEKKRLKFELCEAEVWEE